MDRRRSAGLLKSSLIQRKNGWNPTSADQSIAIKNSLCCSIRFQEEINLILPLSISCFKWAYLVIFGNFWLLQNDQLNINHDKSIQNRPWRISGEISNHWQDEKTITKWAEINRISRITLTRSLEWWSKNYFIIWRIRPFECFSILRWKVWNPNLTSRTRLDYNIFSCD